MNKRNGLIIIGFIFLILIANFVNAEKITLESINITTEDEWFYEQKYYVFVYPLDNNNSIVDIDEATIHLLENFNYSEGNLTRTLDGQYKKWFVIPKQNVTEATVNVTVNQRGKIIEVQKIIDIGEKTFIDKTKIDIGNFLNKWFNWAIKHIVEIIIGIVFLIFLRVVFLIMKREKK